MSPRGGWVAALKATPESYSINYQTNETDCRERGKVVDGRETIRTPPFPSERMKPNEDEGEVRAPDVPSSEIKPESPNRTHTKPTLTASDTEHSFHPALESHFVTKRNILASCGNILFDLFWEN